MSSKRAHFEKEIGLCFLGYNAEFNKAVKREVEKTFHKQQKGERKMSEQENSVVQVGTDKTELATNIFQQKVDDVQKLVEENQQESLDLQSSLLKKQEEKAILLEKLGEINQQLESYELQIKFMNEGIEYLIEAKKSFEKIK